MSNNDRIAELEAQVAALRADLHALKAGQDVPLPQPPAPPTPPVEIPGVRILTVLEERTQDQPSQDELRQLFAIVLPLTPGRLKVDRDLGGFANAFRWAANMRRSDGPNEKYALGFWLDHCKSWLRDRGEAANDVDGAVLIAAILAQGDTAYVRHDGRLGHVGTLGLLTYGGRPADPDGWRRVLSTGNVLSASQPARLTHPPSQVRVYGF